MTATTKISAALLCLALLLCLGTTEGREAAPALEDPAAEMPGVQSVTDKELEGLIGFGHSVFVEFYAPWCGHCKRIAGEFRKLGALVHKNERMQGRLIVAKIDGSAYGELAQRFKVQGYPTILFFRETSKIPVEYDGDRDIEGFKKYLNDKVRGLGLRLPPKFEKIRQIDSISFERDIMQSPNTAALVLFEKKKCYECTNQKGTLDSFVPVYANDDVIVAAITADEDDNMAVAKQFGVTAFPTVLYFPKGDKTEPTVVSFQQHSHEKELDAYVDFFVERGYAKRNETGHLQDGAGIIDELSEPIREMLEAGKNKADLEKAYNAFTDAVKTVKSADAAFYGKLAEKVKEKGAPYVKKELNRLRKMLGDNTTMMHGKKRDSATIRSNILASVYDENL